ncbi:hypothetical protein C8R43DRAFT_1210918 [Mycena crocata]|nr:hypothetical protein C8R43DRAFT_1210918 [Mycena crocata]
MSNLPEPSLLEAVSRIMKDAIQANTHIQCPFNLDGYISSRPEHAWPPPSEEGAEWVKHGRYSFGAAVVLSIRKSHKDIYQMSGQESHKIWEAMTASETISQILKMTGVQPQYPYNAEKTFFAMIFHLSSPSGTYVNDWVENNMMDLLDKVFFDAHRLNISHPPRNIPVPSQFITMIDTLEQGADEEAEEEENTMTGVRLIRNLPRRAR